MKKLVNLLIVLVLFASCNQGDNEKEYIIKGKIKGYKEGAVQLLKHVNDKNPKEFPVKNGEFIIKGKAFAEPTELNFNLKGHFARFGFYVEKGLHEYSAELIIKKTPYGDMAQLKNGTIRGCIVNDQEKAYRKGINELMYKKYDINKIPKDQLEEKLAERDRASEEFNIKYVKNHNNEFYSGYVALMLAHGKNAEGIKEIMDMLDPKLNNQFTKALKAKYKELQKTDVDPSKIIKAKNVKYAIDKSFDGKVLTNVKYLAMLRNNNVCALFNDGKIKFIDPKGKVVKEIDPKTKEKVTSICSHKDVDMIFALYPLKKEVSRKVRGKIMKYKECYAYSCKAFNLLGEEVKDFKLEGITSAFGSRVFDNRLLVSDYNKKSITVFDINSAKEVSEIKGLRPCCLILDFSINAKKEILVANLGAFRVNAFDITGKKLLAFGKRGRGINEFHGCCNPVSVAYLNSGAIVTVEKDPTRVKIYSNEGAKQVEGIDELVKGCSYIPMIVDAKDNLYLASPKKGMIKCSAVK